jgi:hypothetical protein
MMTAHEWFLSRDFNEDTAGGGYFRGRILPAEDTAGH